MPKNKLTNFPYTKFNDSPIELHRMALDRVATGSVVLDVGCATGAFAKKLKDKGCKVYGLELNPDAAEVARGICEKVEVVDLNTITHIPFKLKFDYIMIMEVVEHLVEAERLLKICAKYLKKDGRIIVSTPNISYVNMRVLHLLGKFDYTETGILDRTHVHLYTKKTFVTLLQNANLQIEDLDFTSVLRNVLYIGRLLSFLPKRLQRDVSRKLSTLLGYQFVATCKRSN